MPKDLTQGEVRRLLDYDPVTGQLTNRIDRPNAKAGVVAGFVASGPRQGYRIIKIHGGTYCSGPLIWLWMTGKWPTDEVDHKNLDRADDRWENLREATRSQNCASKGGFYKKNAYGYRGVKRQPSGRFQAVICVNQKEYSLGTWDTPAEAAQRYDEAAKKYHGEFARLNFPQEKINAGHETGNSGSEIGSQGRGVAAE